MQTAANERRVRRALLLLLCAPSFAENIAPPYISLSRNPELSLLCFLLFALCVVVSALCVYLLFVVYFRRSPCLSHWGSLTLLYFRSLASLRQLSTPGGGYFRSPGGD